jgi:2Fe-2S type ferredoxin
MASYRVTLIDRIQNFEQTIDVPDTQPILMEAADQGIKIPFECVLGACATCEAKLISGAVDQSEQMFLSDAQIEAGLVLTCVAKPLSDCVLEIMLDNYL